MTATKRTRREYDAEFKAEVVKACSAPGVSVAGVALGHGLNANLVRRWLSEHGVLPPSRRTMENMPAAPEPMYAGEFVPVTVEASKPSLPDIRIELRRGGAVATVHWPLEAADTCGAWLRDWLR